MFIPVWLLALVAFASLVAVLALRKLAAQRDGARIAAEDFYHDSLARERAVLASYAPKGHPSELRSVVFGEEREMQLVSGYHLVSFAELRQLRQLQGADAVAYRERLWRRAKEQILATFAPVLMEHATVYCENDVDGLGFRVALYAVAKGTTPEEERSLAEGWLTLEPQLPTNVGAP